MAKNVIINGATYNAVPYVLIPQAGGGGNATFYDTSDATAQAANILAGYSAYGTNGAVTGTATMPSVSQDQTSKVLTIS
jgi:hypothetical protein